VTKAVRAVCGDKGDIVGIHDDLVVIGGSSVLANALPVFVTELKRLELTTNSNKMAVWFPAVTENGQRLHHCAAEAWSSGAQKSA
jgi:hypothetical protein